MRCHAVGDPRIAATDSAGMTPSITIGSAIAVRIDEGDAHDRTEIVDDGDSGAVRRPRGIDVAVGAGQHSLVGAVGVGNMKREGPVRLRRSGRQGGRRRETSWARPRRVPASRGAVPVTRRAYRIQRSMGSVPVPAETTTRFPSGCHGRRVDAGEWGRVKDPPVRAVGVHRPIPLPSRPDEVQDLRAVRGEDRRPVDGLGIADAYRRARAVGSRDEDLVVGVPTVFE